MEGLVSYYQYDLKCFCYKEIIILYLQRNMNDQPYKAASSDTHELYWNLIDPFTLVAVKKMQEMNYLAQSPIKTNNSNHPIPNHFPNYYILNNIEVSHKQKLCLHVMVKQPTSPEVMIHLFLKLAKRYYPGHGWQIQELEKDLFLQGRVQDADILRRYTKESFFYRLLNQLLRAGKDSTELYYCQYFVKLLFQAIKNVYKKQKQQPKQEMPSNFRCYRGANFSQQQLQELQTNTGRNLETLGFLSASLQKQTAQMFITNSLVEISVSDLPRDEDLDSGFAYLTEDYSEKPHEKEVLFNVLSSFKIVSVEKTEHYGTWIWLIKLEYGVTYQMMRKYKQNRLSLERGSRESQQILAILSWQDSFKQRRRQQQCLISDLSLEQYVWMMKVRINLCKTHHGYEEAGQNQEVFMYLNLISNTQFHQKQAEFIKQVKSKLMNRVEHQCQSSSAYVKFRNLQNIQLMIENHYQNQNYKEVTALTKKWRQLKQKLDQNAEFQKQLKCHPFICGQLQQIQMDVRIRQVLSNLAVYHSMQDQSRLIQELRIVQKLKKQLLQKDGRYGNLYGELNKKYLYYSCDLGLVGYEAWLNNKEWEIIRLKGIQFSEKLDLQAKLVPVFRKAEQHLQRKSWTMAVKACSELRDKQLQGNQSQDHHFFEPIVAFLNRWSCTFADKVDLVQAGLGVKHPQQSGFCKQMKKALSCFKIKQLQLQRKYTYIIENMLWQPPRLIFANLQNMKQMLQIQLPKNSKVRVGTQCLIVNTMRMLGWYELAHEHFTRIQAEMKNSHPEYYQQLYLSQFEQ